jgi:hypothetical protein
VLVGCVGGCWGGFWWGCWGGLFGWLWCCCLVGLVVGLCGFVVCVLLLGDGVGWWFWVGLVWGVGVVW